MIIESQFKPAWWLSNPHAQTIYPAIVKADIAPITRTEQLELPDGDFISLVWAEKDLGKDTPLIVIIHGLCGGLRSSYVPRLMNAANNQGWRAVLMHLRGAGDAVNRLPKMYHTGDTQDLNYFLNQLAIDEPNSKKAVIGVSLGGNIFLKWLGEGNPNDIVETGVAISVPFDIRFIANRMCRGLSKMYQMYLLREMREAYQRKLKLGADKYPPTFAKMDNCQCFWTWDEYITAPLHGYPNVHAYYRDASSKYYLNKIDTPVLILHALDDPFMTPQVIPKSEQLSPAVTLEISQKGGHVGFISGQIPGKAEYWLDHRILEYLQPYFI